MQQSDTSEQALCARLREAGVSPTAQRLQIARVLLERPQHLSADQLMDLLHNRHDYGVSKATVYNTLGLFARVGLVREVFADPNRVFYDSNTSEHHHLFNVEQGTLTDLPADQVSLLTLPELGNDLELAGVDIIIRVRPSS